jgi:hypothetical protein
MIHFLAKNKFLIFLKYMSKSFGILQTCCKMHATFLKTCQNILDIIKKNAQIIFRIFGHMQGKKKIFYYYYFNYFLGFV